MRFAVLTADQTMVENVIVARADQKEELEAALGRTLLDASPLGMQIGDLFNGTSFNTTGAQTNYIAGTEYPTSISYTDTGFTVTGPTVPIMIKYIAYK